jgi:hypothetical protein
MNPGARTLGGLAVWACAAIAGGALAQTPDAKKPTEPAGDQMGALVEMRPFLMTVESAPGRREYVRAPATVFLRMAGGKDPQAICPLLPRVRDAVLESLYGVPVPASYLSDPAEAGNPDGPGLLRTAEQAPMDNRLVGAVNAALENSLVAGVIVVKGARGADAGLAEKVGLPAAVTCEKPDDGKGKPKEKKKEAAKAKK